MGQAARVGALGTVTSALRPVGKVVLDAQAAPGEHQKREGQRREQHHVLTRHGQQMGEAACAKVLSNRSTDALVLAQHHAA